MSSRRIAAAFGVWIDVKPGKGSICASTMRHAVRPKGWPGEAQVIDILEGEALHGI